jgi:hypothetical protein
MSSSAIGRRNFETITGHQVCYRTRSRKVSVVHLKHTGFSVECECITLDCVTSQMVCSDKYRKR